MIDYIKGKVVNKNPGSVIIEAGGLGYDIHITIPAYEKLPAAGQETKVITHFHAKDNPVSFILYGFSDERERECFRQIISVSGIGPKTAITILSAINYNDFIEMITSGNYLPLTSVSGVGRKTAERLAIELKEKIGKSVEAVMPSVDGVKFGMLSKASEVIQALVALGYNRLEADKLVKNTSISINFADLSVEEIIRDILRSK